MLCVGSTALSFFDSIDLDRKPKDVDVICTEESFKEYIRWHLKRSWRIVSLENKNNTKVAFLRSNIDDSVRIIEANIWKFEESNLVGSDSWMLNNLPEKYYYIEYGKEFGHNDDIMVVRPEVVLMMKLSHRYKKDSVHFQKTRKDILSLRKQGVKLDDYLSKVLVERQRLMNPAGYKLNTTKANFFVDNVPYKYDHDSLHLAVSYPLNPAYTFYMQDGAEVMCDKDKFFEIPECIRLQGVFEEACVLALERAIIPHNTDPTKAFEIALEKVCTSITKGWFREYAWENYDKVRSMFNPDKLVGAFCDGLNRGTIKPYQQTQE